jgi:Zn-finger nucleic acid-binding protein
MQCPTCSTELQRSQYEGLPIFHCAACHGHLVATRRAADIARSHEKSPEALRQEALLEAAPDSADVLRCPRCRRQMAKEFLRGTDSFHIDKCRECQLIWFDGGELAKWQLAYEATDQGQEAATLRKRHEQMDPAAKREFEENLARLPESESPLEAAVGEAFWQSFGKLLWALFGR